MNRKLKAAAVLGVLAVAAVVLVLNRQEISRLRRENADLRSQLDVIASLQESNAYLSGQLKAVTDASRSGESELLRLRGQGSKLRQLEQENAQLKSERQPALMRLEKAQGGVVPSEEQGLVRAVPQMVKAPAVDPTENTTDLGSLELRSGISVHFDLGGGTNCVVTPSVLSDGNNVLQLTLGVTNSDGTFSELGRSRLTIRPGQPCSVSLGGRMLALAVSIEAP